LEITEMAKFQFHGKRLKALVFLIILSSANAFAVGDCSGTTRLMGRER